MQTEAPRCQARKKQGGSCRSMAVKGKRVCRIHGGSKGSGAPKGPANGMYKHGHKTGEALELRKQVSRLLGILRPSDGEVI
ncbi:HGGxSTG domain-containing protein [Aquisediminimonas profunda]|uniref:HGGxSTG domain-containing protein n=1 Tax=Aquisediminimonas profunda TaxID=1550733 RepID=UPI003CCE9B86